MTTLAVIYNYLIFADMVTLECGQNNFQVCQGARVTISCFTETAIGYLRWVNITNGWLAAFNSSSAVNDVITKDNINFTLRNKYEIHEDHHQRHLYYSTAVIDVRNDTTIGCSDGDVHVKQCIVETISE